MGKGRQPKEGLDFAGWEVGVLDNDTKLDRLIEAQGIAAFTVYFYLCQHAYATHGYYLDWDYSCCAATARKLGKGASAEFVKNVVDMCLKCDLFDKQAFDAYGVLTSRGIQRRYSGAVKRRIPDEGPKKFWLLENSQGFDECTQNSDSQPENGISATENAQTVQYSTEQNITVHDSTHMSSFAVASASVNYKEIMDAFNRICVDLPKVREVTDARRTAIRKAEERLRDKGGFEPFFEQIHRSDFLCGRGKGDRPWKCSFDWVLKPSNMVKILEGNFDSRTKSTNEDDESYNRLVAAYVPKYKKKGT